MSAQYATGGDNSAMPCSAGMVANMPSLVSEEERASPPTGQRSGDYRGAKERQAEHLFLLARGFTFLDHGQSARGADHSPGSPRCTLASADLCQEAADQTIDNLAYGQPRPVGEVLISTREALDLHAPSIRMETMQCPVIKTTEKFCGISA